MPGHSHLGRNEEYKGKMKRRRKDPSCENVVRRDFWPAAAAGGRPTAGVIETPHFQTDIEREPVFQSFRAAVKSVNVSVFVKFPIVVGNH